MTMSNVDHPAHYGGEQNPYEVIKVLKHWLTPTEFVGFCKGNMMKYTARANDKGGLEDHEKAVWYAQQLTGFIRDQRAEGEHDGLPVEPMFWADLYPCPCPDRDEIIACCEHGCVVMLCSTVEPHVTWFVTLGDDQGESETKFFRAKAEADRHLGTMLELGRQQRADATERACKLVAEGKVEEAGAVADEHGLEWSHVRDLPFVEVERRRVYISRALVQDGASGDGA